MKKYMPLILLVIMAFLPMSACSGTLPTLPEEGILILFLNRRDEYEKG